MRQLLAPVARRAVGRRAGPALAAPDGPAPSGAPQDVGAPGRRRLNFVGDARWETVAVLVFSTALAVALYRHAWRHPNSVHPGGWGDADEYTWFLSWVPYALGHGLNPLVSSYVNLAARGRGQPDVEHLGAAARLPRVPAHRHGRAGRVLQLPHHRRAAFSAAAAYLAFRRWSSAAPALVGALVFGFSPSVASQSVGHLAQVLLMSVPLVLICSTACSSAIRQTVAGRAGLGAAGLGQLLTGEEVLAMEAVAAAIGVVVLLAINARGAVYAHLRLRRQGLGRSRGSFAVLSAPFLAEQYGGPHRVQDVHPVNYYVSDLVNFFSPTNITQLAPRAAQHLAAHFTGNGSEQGADIGFPLLVLMAMACVLARRRKVTWVALSVAAGTALLSMGSS